jgi:hypothetical protein
MTEQITANGGGTVLIGMLCFCLGAVFTIALLTFLNRNSKYED